MQAYYNTPSSCRNVDRQYNAISCLIVESSKYDLQPFCFTRVEQVRKRICLYYYTVERRKASCNDLQVKNTFIDYAL